MKSDLSIEWESTMNVGNYSNIQPKVNITLKDVDAGNVYLYKTLTNIVHSLWIVQVHALLSEVKTSLELSRNGYYKALDDAIMDVKKDLVNEVKNIGKDISKEDYEKLLDEVREYEW